MGVPETKFQLVSCAVIVPEAPKAMLVPFTVIEELARELLGRLRVELAAP